jgi:hypothetical protein
MQHNPSWEANSFSASQEIPQILWNLKVHYRIHNSQPNVLALSQKNPFHVTHVSSGSILILSSNLYLGIPSGLLPSVFTIKTLYTFLFFLKRVVC